MPNPTPELLATRIVNLGFTPFVCNRLVYVGHIQTVAELIEQTGDDLLGIYGFGDRSLKQVEQRLERLGLALKPVLTVPTGAVAPPDGIALAKLNLSTRAFGRLMRAGIDTVGQLTEKSRDDLLDIRDFGPVALDDVVDALKRRGLSLREEAPHV